MFDKTFSLGAMAGLGKAGHCRFSECCNERPHDPETERRSQWRELCMISDQRNILSRIELI